MDELCNSIHFQSFIPKIIRIFLSSLKKAPSTSILHNFSIKFRGILERSTLYLPTKKNMSLSDNQFALVTGREFRNWKKQWPESWPRENIMY